MNRELFKLIQQKFNEELEKKNSWGKNEIKDVYNKVAAEATLEMLDRISEPRYRG